MTLCRVLQHAFLTSLLFRTERDAKGYEDGMTLGPVLRPELPVAAQVRVPRLTTNTERIAQLWPDRCDARLERSDLVAAPAVARELVVDIAHDPDLPALR